AGGTGASALVSLRLREASSAGKSIPTGADSGAACGRARAATPASRTAVRSNNPGRAASSWRGSRAGSRASAGRGAGAVPAGSGSPRCEPGRAGASAVSAVFVLRNAVANGFILVLDRVAAEMVLHQKGVFATVLVVRPQHADRAEALRPEKQ